MPTVFHDIFFGLLILLIAPFLGAALHPDVAVWFATCLLKHAAAMRAFYPAIKDAFVVYRTVYRRFHVQAN